MILDILNTFVEYVIRDPLTQITWFFGMFTILIGYFQKDDKEVKKYLLISAIFWGAHFYMLWVYSGLAAIIIWVARILLSLKFKKSKYAFLFIVISTIIIWFFTFEWIVSMLPIVASLTWAYSYFYLEKVKLRLVMIFNSWMYLVYNYFVGSISWVINEILVQVILGFTVYRMIHPQWWTRYYLAKLRGIIHRNYDDIDYDRFIFIQEKILRLRKKSWIHINNVLAYDIRNLVPNIHIKLFQKHKDTLKEKLIKKLSFKNLIPQK